MGLLGSVVVEDFLLPVGTLAIGVRIGVAGSRTAVDVALVDEERVLAGVQHVSFPPRAGNAVGEVVVDVSLALGTLLGGHEDDAVRGARTIDSAGSSVLQDLDGLDVGRVEVIDTAGDRHAVHDVDRVGGVDGADTADADAGRGARLTGSGRDGHAGGQALEGVVHAGRGGDGESIRIDLGDGRGHHGFLLDTVTDDHGLFENLRVILKDDDQILRTVVDDHLGGVADAGNLDRGSLAGRNGEVAVNTRHGTVGGTLLNHERTDDRLVGIVHDRTLEGDVLGQRCQAES